MTGDSFFDSVRSLGIQRPDDTPLAGVCAALAKRWNVDPLLVRAVAVALTFLGGAGITLYALGWLLLPDTSERIHAQEPFYGKVSASLIIGIILVFVPLSSFSFGFVDIHLFGPFGIVLAAIIVTIVVVSTSSSDRQDGQTSSGATSASDDTLLGGEPSDRRDSWPQNQQASASSDRSELYATVDLDEPDHRPVTSSRVVLLALALLLILAAAVAIMVDQGFTPLTDSNLVLAAFAGASVVLGVTVVLYGVSGRRGGGLSAVAITVAAMTFPVTAMMSVPSAEHHVIMGEGSWAPTSAEETEGGYSMLMGSIELDVTELDEAEIDLSGRLGEVILVVDDDQKVAIVADYVISDVSGADRPDSSTTGVAGDATFYIGGIDSVGEADIVIHVDLIAADFSIERQS